MDLITRLTSDPKTLLDVDVAGNATQTSKVFVNARGMLSMSLELTITPAVNPVNMTMRVLGEDSVPATDTTRLIPFTSIPLPDLSALSAPYTAIVDIPVQTGFFQVEFQCNTSNGAHVKCVAWGSESAYTPGNAAQSVTLSKAVDVAVYSPCTYAKVAADTSMHAVDKTQAVKTPIFIKVEQTMVGTVTISDGTNAGAVLAKGDTMPFYGTNLNQIYYQFSQNATTERFSMSAGI
jgi:hypothetical protein